MAGKATSSPKASGRSDSRPRLAPIIVEATGGRVNLRILSNLADRRKAVATCMIPAQELTTETLDGKQVVKRIVVPSKLVNIVIR